MSQLHSFTIGTPANRQTAVLSDDDLRRHAPSVFAEQEHESRSSRYAFIPTSKVVAGLRDNGFLPVKVSVQRVRDKGRCGFEKHMIRFRQNTDIVKVGDVFPELVLVNSHDGSTSYQLSSGLYRLACSNGLVVSQGELEAVKIKHCGSEREIIRDVVDGSFRVLGQSQKAIETAGRWSQLQLTDGEQAALAIGAHHARFADSEGNIATPIVPAQLLLARRPDDRKADLWTTFNRIQENAIKGGLHGVAVETDDRGRLRRRNVSTREVKGIDGNISLNRAIWAMAEHLAKLKAGN